MSKKLKITAIGDSLTYGYLLEDDSKKWTNILSEKLDLEIINKGINGNTTKDILQRFDQDILKQKSDIVIIWCGVNDLFQEISLEEVVENISLMHKKCLENGIKPILISSTPLNIQHLDTQDDYIKYAVDTKVSKLSHKFKEKGYDFIDLYTPFKLNQKDKDYSKYFTDNLHLSYKGNKLVSEILFKELINMI